MSRLGFDRIISELPRVTDLCLKEMMVDSRKEFDQNFKGEKNSESGADWKAVKRPVPPPILDVTGNLKGTAIRSGRVVVRGNKATLTIDPIDARGRGYASFHQDGFTHKQAGWIAPRSYVTHSILLDQTHIATIHRYFDPLFL